MTEQTNTNQSQFKSEEPTTEETGSGLLLDLGIETARTYSYNHTCPKNGAEVPLAIGFENVDEELGKYSQVIALSSFVGINLYLYGLVELEQAFKDIGLLDQLSEEEREVLSIAFSANDYLKNYGVVVENVPDAVETK